MSTIERAARKVAFDPVRTLVYGKNQTGKSSLLKSIYWVLGAEPAVVHPRWQSADVMGLLRFQIDGEETSILRHGGTFCVFDSNSAIQRKFNRVMGGLGAFLAELFAFRLKLPSRDGGEAVTPPPSFQFLPYYIDQDESWKKNWAAFSKLGQFFDWKRDVAEFHLGVRPNEYYELKGRKTALEAEVQRLEAELRIIGELIKQIRSSFDSAQFDINPDAFRDEINSLVETCNKLLLRENTYKAKFTELHNERAELTEQIEFTKRAAADLDKDYHFVTEKIPEGKVPCPVCGTEYQNSFAERFSIAADEDRLLILVGELSARVAELDHRISLVRDDFRKTEQELGQIRPLLEKRREAVTFAEVLKSEGKREADVALGAKKDESTNAHGLALAQLRDLSKKLASLTDRRRTEQIAGRYRSAMKENLLKLSVLTLPEKDFASIDSSIRETGSNLPRALLAYYFSVLTTIREFGDGTFFPIVIDSPNQQAQDKTSLAAMLKFIRDNQPKDSQLILGFEDDLGVDIPGTRINLVQKHHLMTGTAYAEVRASLAPFIDQMLATDLSPIG
jgi:predicted  nucleic acid-binding Zn-ribbon protein